MTLRRLGLNSGTGQPPVPASDLTGIEFLVTTLDPQTEEASFDLNRRLSIDPLVTGRTPADLYDLRDLRQACVLTVLARRYAAEVRGNQGDFALKLAEIKQELEQSWPGCSSAGDPAARPTTPRTGSPLESYADHGDIDIMALLVPREGDVQLLTDLLGGVPSRIGNSGCFTPRTSRPPKPTRPPPIPPRRQRSPTTRAGRSRGA